jgi:tRNA(Ile)-lysidine synthase
MAMLHLAAGWAHRFGVGLRVATVDHGLRPESAAEARLVADEAQGLGVPHDVLHWRDQPTGNLQDAARRARYRLLSEWLAGSRHLLVAHTADDQAETLLMRLARGSGVDGLSAMRPMTRRDGMVLVRPLLGERRAALRHHAKTLNIPIVDDPSNEDDHYGRVRLRRLIGQEGLDVDTLGATARRMARAQEALSVRALSIARTVLGNAGQGTDVVMIDRDPFAQIESETQMRILAATLQASSGAGYRPREAALEAGLQTLLDGGTVTLHGAMAVARGKWIFVGREPKAVAERAVPTGEKSVWDKRWRLDTRNIADAEIRALGPEGAQQLRDAGANLPQNPPLPAVFWHAQPAIWRANHLLAFGSARFGLEYGIQSPDTCGICFSHLKPH